MRPWYTGKPCERTRRSHINVCIYDSAWEATDAFALDASEHVAAWVKNDHLGFEVLYVYRGVVRKYRPDFLVRLTNGVRLVLETKGRESEQDRVKRCCLNEWAAAVNAHGGFGEWRAATAKTPGEIRDILPLAGHSPWRASLKDSRATNEALPEHYPRPRPKFWDLKRILILIRSA